MIKRNRDNSNNKDNREHKVTRDNSNNKDNREH